MDKRSQSLKRKKCPTTESGEFLVCDPMTLVLEWSDPFQILSSPNQSHKKETVLTHDHRNNLMGLWYVVVLQEKCWEIMKNVT